MNCTRARNIVIEKLIDFFFEEACKTQSVEDAYRVVLRYGFEGFMQRTNQSLLEEVYEAGLQEQDDELNEACETLEEPVP